MAKFKKYLCSFLAFCMLFLMSVTAFAKGEIEYEYYVENGKAVLTEYLGDSKNVVVPSEIDGYIVEKLEGTFCDNRKIKKVEIPEGIKSIGEKTFYGCENLKNVSIPYSVSELGPFAFAYSGIRSVVLGPEIHYISEGCFAGCSKLFVVEAQAKPNDVSNISCYVGFDAFQDSSVKILFNEYGFGFYDTMPSNVKYFYRTSIIYYMYNFALSRPMIVFITLFGDMGLILGVLYTVSLLAIIIILLVAFGRLFLLLIGKNYVALYKAYSNIAFAEMGDENIASDIIYYKKIEFTRDKILRALKVAFWILVAFIYIGLICMIMFSTDVLNDRPFLKSTVVFLCSFVVIGIIIYIFYRIRCFVNEHKKYSDKPRIRIRKIHTGGKKDA